MTGSLLTLIGILALVLVTLTLNFHRTQSGDPTRTLWPLAIALGIAIGLGVSAMVAVQSVLGYAAFAAGGAAVLALLFSLARQDD